MCGIYLAVSRTGHVLPTAKISALLASRGPDSIRYLTYRQPLVGQPAGSQPGVGTVSIDTDNVSEVFITCVSSVLSLRGYQTVDQPLTGPIQEHESLASPVPSFLCWNGEAWTFAGTSIQGNDSEHVLRLLSHICHFSTSFSPEMQERAVAEALSAYAGPYAFAYYDSVNQKLYYGRDFLGRRSLLYRVTEAGELIISSVGDGIGVGWQEVEADGIYHVDLSSIQGDGGFNVKRTPYHYDSGTASPAPRRSKLVRSIKLSDPGVPY